MVLDIKRKKMELLTLGSSRIVFSMALEFTRNSKAQSITESGMITMLVDKEQW